MPSQPAVLGTMRLGNFRLGYVPAALAAVRAARVSILLDGIERRARVKERSVTSQDVLNDAPNRCDLTFRSWVEQIGMTTPYLEAVLADAPLAYWPGDVPSGALLDVVGGRHGTLSGSATYGQPGFLNDASTAILLASGGYNLPGTWTAPKTIVAWIKTTAVSGKIWTNLDTNPIYNGPTIEVGLNASGIPYIKDWFFSAPHTVTATVAINDGVKHQLVVTRTGGSSRIYVDGLLVKTASQNSGAGDSRPASIGAFVGTFGQVALYYGTALSLAQIQALHAAAATAPAPIYDTLIPTVSQSLRVTVGVSPARLLFNGALQTVDASYEGEPPELVCPCTAIDDTARANQRRPFGTFVATPADEVAVAITTQCAPGFSTAGIVVGLPPIDIVFDGSETWIAAMARIASGIGGYCKAEDLTAYLFLEDTTDAPDPLDGTPGRFFDEPRIVVRVDDSQVVTRCYGKGLGVALLASLVAGETVWPIDDATSFNPIAGQAIAATTPDGATSEIVNYNGLQLGGAGSLVGPGTGPSTAPTVTAIAGAALGTGSYQYAQVHVTAAGKSLPSPLATVLTGPIAAPTALSIQNATGQYETSDEWNGWDVGHTVEWYYAYGDESGPNTASAASPTVSLAAVANPNGYYFHSPSHPSPMGMILTLQYAADPRVTQIWVWVRINGATWMTLFPNGSGYGNLPQYGGSYFQLRLSSVGLIGWASGYAPTNPSRNQVAVDGLALGPSGTTAREIYRTAVGGAQLKHLTTIGDNTTTGGYVDSAADGSLGANVVMSDTSGFTQPEGQVLAGATELPTASAAPYVATGGWAILPSGDVIRYTGITDNLLTGIPPSGPGSIQTTVLYGSPLVAAPALLGVTGLTKDLQKGAPVHIWVQRDDLVAQADAALRETTPDWTSDGVHEDLVVDERRAEPSLIAVCDAKLAKVGRPLVTVVYETRHVKDKSGKTLHVDLTTPVRVGPIDLVIQEVTTTDVNVFVGQLPRKQVTASNARFSFEDILRRLAA